MGPNGTKIVVSGIGNGDHHGPGGGCGQWQIGRPAAGDRTVTARCLMRLQILRKVPRNSHRYPTMLQTIRPLALFSVAAALLVSSPLGAEQETAAPPPAAAAAKNGKVSHVDAAGAEKAVAATKDLVIVDVRTPAEFAKGHLKGAINLDFLAPGFAAKIAKLDPKKPILIHCQSGGRSTQALPSVEAIGFPTILHLDGGFASWQAAGYPVEK